MIISPGRKFIFVHIPKTGGTAMALALEARAHRDDILIGDTPKAQRRKNRLKDLQPRGRLWKHSTLVDIDGVLTPEALATQFIFTLVRNPWDRMVSYYHWLQAQTFDHAAIARAKALDFSAFLHHPETIKGLKTHTYHSYVQDVDGVNRCNLFARLEHLETDLAPFWDHVGFQVPVPRRNATQRIRDWRQYYSDADAQALGQYAAADIAPFEYRFD